MSGRVRGISSARSDRKLVWGWNRYYGWVCLRNPAVYPQEKLGRRHQYQGRSVPTLIWTHDYTVQYFAVFDEVVDPIGRNVKRRFISVLQHEIDFRIAKLAAKGK